MSSAGKDTAESLLDPIDLDRLAIDEEYRRELIQRLKAESVRDGAAASAVTTPGRDTRKD